MAELFMSLGSLCLKKNGIFRGHMSRKNLNVDKSNLCHEKIYYDKIVIYKEITQKLLVLKIY